jgi:hypothetical protein
MIPNPIGIVVGIKLTIAFIESEETMLSFELVESGKAIQISADKEGLSLLRKALDQVSSAGHLHLLSAANGGKELNDITSLGKAAIGEVIITTV